MKESSLHQTVKRAGLLLAVLFGVASCGGSSTSSSTTSPDVIVSTTANMYERQTVYLVRNMMTSFEVVPVYVDSKNIASNDEDAVQGAVVKLLMLTGTELDALNKSQDSTFESAVPAGTTFLGVEIDNGIVIINLGGAIVGSSGSSTQESMFAEQLTNTALLNPTLTGLRLEINGVTIDELWGHIDWSEPLRF